MVIAHVGGHDRGALTAFDAKTGAVRWRWSGDGPSYASPIIVTSAGIRQVVTQTQKQCVGVSTETGKLLWSFPFTTPYVQNAVTPVAVGDAIVLSGLQQGTFAIRIRKQGEHEVRPYRVWETRDAWMYLSSPVAAGSTLYGMSEKRSGQLFSLSTATGKVLWTGEGRFGDNAAILDAGTALLVLTPDASLHIYRKAGSALQEAARYQVAESPTWATPAVVRNRILVKDQTSLTLWQVAE